jgi:hypothetical protein
MRSREDRRCRLPLKLTDGEPRVLSGGEDFLVLLDECTDERLQLVERRAAALDVLLEGERQLSALLQLAPEQYERPEYEAAEERVEVRGPRGHDSRLRDL